MIILHQGTNKVEVAREAYPHTVHVHAVQDSEIKINAKKNASLHAPLIYGFKCL